MQGAAKGGGERWSQPLSFAPRFPRFLRPRCAFIRAEQCIMIFWVPMGVLSMIIRIWIVIRDGGGVVSILFPAAKAKTMWDEPKLIEFSSDEETAPLCYRSTPSSTSDVSSTVTSHDYCSSEGNSSATSFCVDCHSNLQQQQKQKLSRSSFPPCNLKCGFWLRNDESKVSVPFRKRWTVRLLWWL